MEVNKEVVMGDATPIVAEEEEEEEEAEAEAGLSLTNQQ
jgi:hypothetical protein